MRILGDRIPSWAFLGLLLGLLLSLRMFTGRRNDRLFSIPRETRTPILALTHHRSIRPSRTVVTAGRRTGINASGGGGRPVSGDATDLPHLWTLLRQNLHLIVVSARRRCGQDLYLIVVVTAIPPRRRRTRITSLSSLPSPASGKGYGAGGERQEDDEVDCCLHGVVRRVGQRLNIELDCEKLKYLPTAPRRRSTRGNGRGTPVIARHSPNSRRRLQSR